MLPYLGQGARQAMEDGVVLAAALDRFADNPSTALQVYERARLPRASRVVLTARDRGEDNHLVSPLAALRRDALIAIRRRFARFGADPTGRGTAWIFDYDPASPEALTPVGAAA
jgi:2-polyprenyl-6-methoxyphenol hydroxylase-like FAD-dependent oxidoreductase